MRYLLALIVLGFLLWQPVIAQAPFYFVSSQLAPNPQNGQCLTTNGATSTWGSCGTGGSGTPGGTNGQLQFNDNGVFGGISTSSLGLRFTGLADTQSTLTANRLIFASSTGGSLTDSEELVFQNGTLGVGTSTLPGNIKLFTSATLRSFGSFANAVYNNESFRTGIFKSGSTNGAPDVLIIDQDNSSTRAALQIQGNGSTTQVAFFGSNGNVGLGTTTPTARLSNIGTSLFGGILTMDGNVANIALGQNFLSGDGGDEGVFVDNIGRVGIGTTTPSATLTVSGTTTLFGYTRCGTASPPALEPFVQTLLDCWGADPDGAYGVIGNLSSGTNAYAGLVLNNDGVRSDGANYGGIFLSSTNFTGGFNPFVAVPNAVSIENTMGPILLMSGTTSNSYIAFATNGNGTADEQVRITAAGDVGIGTTNPQQALSVLAPGNTDGIQLRRNSTSAGSAANLGFRISTSEGVDGARLQVIRTNSPGSGDTEFAFTTTGSTTLAERVRINSLGNIGIGTTTPSARLTVLGVAGEALATFISTLGTTVMTIAQDLVSVFSNFYVQGVAFFGTTSVNGGTSTAQVVISGHVETLFRIEQNCTSPTGEITQVTGDVLRGCGRFSYLEDANGVLDFVRPTTGTTTYYRLRPGATGATTAAGDGMGIGWADGLNFGNLHNHNVVMSWAMRQDAMANATSTIVFGGLTSRVTVGADFATEPLEGFYVIATSTSQNYQFACNPAGVGATYFDTGIATSTTSVVGGNPFVFFLLSEENSTTSDSVTMSLKAQQAGGSLTQVAQCTISTTGATQAIAPTVAIGKSSAGNSSELHVPWIKFGYDSAPF